MPINILRIGTDPPPNSVSLRETREAAFATGKSEKASRGSLGCIGEQFGEAE